MKKFFVLLMILLMIPSLVCCTKTPTLGTYTSSSTDEEPETTDTSNATPQEIALDILSKTKHHVGLCDQKNGRIIICDLAETDWTNDNAVVWEYKHNTQGHENYGWIAGIKFRDNDFYSQDVLLFCAPRSKGYIVSMATKEVLLEVQDAGVNPHSVELLPNGIFIVGSSNDGRVAVYAPGRTTPNFTITLNGSNNSSNSPDVHGVLWDPKYEVLWVAGGSILRSFKVDGTVDNPRLVLVDTYYAPYSSIHDLTPIYGDPDGLLLTTAGGIIKFDKVNKKFSYDYSCSISGRAFGYVPGCGLYTDGVLTFTAITDSTKVYQDWDTNIVFVCVPLPDGKRITFQRKAPKDAYYKLRIFDTNYQ